MQTINSRPGPFLVLFFILILNNAGAQDPVQPADIRFVRQGVKRLIFADDQAIPLASLEPGSIIGMASMHPTHHFTTDQPRIRVTGDQLQISADTDTESSIWLGGFNPFATYTLDLQACFGKGSLGFEFADQDKRERFLVSVVFENSRLIDVRLRVITGNEVVTDESILLKEEMLGSAPAKIILQLLGSGLNLFIQREGLPLAVAQSDFNQYLDLRQKRCLQQFQSGIHLALSDAEVRIGNVRSALTTGLGQADIRAITYKDGRPFMDQGRLWYTLSIRGRALPHHIQGVFSLDPSVFDLRMEGVIVFDQDDGILRNEISTHLFYDEEHDHWRGLTTGFSAYARPEEQKQILAIESKKDPRFGFSIMKARPTGIVGDIEDSHILYDTDAQKWRLLTCENLDGYKAVIMESDTWDRDYHRIAGPVTANSTGTSIERIDGRRYCFSGSSDRKVYIYTYPDLQSAGTLQMDLPPWDASSRTRIWPNVVELPDGYPTKYIALMMDRYNFPGQKGPHWTYGALYLYHGSVK